MEKSYYDGLKELREAGSAEDANKLLKEGYEVLRITDRTSTDLQTKAIVTGPIYVLGRRGNNQDAKPVQNEHYHIPNLEWKIKEGNEGFSWAFVGDRDGKVSQENKEFRDLLKQKSEIWEGEYSYRLSKDEHFFNRIKHEGEKKQ